MVKVFFADGGDLPSLRATLARIVAEAEERASALGTFAAAPPTFPERAHISALTLALRPRAGARHPALGPLGGGRGRHRGPTPAEVATGMRSEVLRSVARRALDEVAGFPG